MQSIEVLAFAVGLALLVLIAVISLRGPSLRGRRGREGPIIPLSHRHGNGDGGDDGGADG
jgi:hypothetical protein